MTALKLAPGLSLPIEAITETIAILGIRNSGKTNTAAVYAEELLAAGQQVVIIDPTDAWWGLKSSADGQKPGYPVVVLGGRHADLPLASTDGKLIADFVVEQGASVICSLRGFESKQQEMRFTTDFLRRLYYLKGQQDAPTPLSLIIDEASRLVPQRVMGEDAACVGAVQQIVRQGRSSGFGIGLIDQRAATVNKDVLAQLEMLVVHRTTGPQDRKALQEWIVAHDTAGREKEFLGSLASLAQGEAWFWSPGWLDLFKKVQVRKRRTFDSSRTPRAGEVAVTPKKVAEVDLEALRGKLAATLEKAKADDPKLLRAEIVQRDRRIAELERGSDKAPEGWVPHETMVSQIEAAVTAARREEAGYYERLLRAVEQSRELLSRAGESAYSAADALALAVRENGEGRLRAPAPTPTRMVNLPTRRENGRVTQAAVMEIPKPAPAPAREKKSSSDGALPPTQQKILDAMAELRQLGVEEPSRTQVGMWASRNIVGGGGGQHVADLVEAGLLEIPVVGALRLTAAGIRAAHPEAAPRDLNELHARVLNRLPGAQQRILSGLLEIHPAANSRSDLGARVGLNIVGGGGGQHVADLINRGAAEIPTTGKLRASDLLFPEGLR